MKLRALNLSSFLLCTAKKEKRLAGLVKYQSEAQLPGPGRVVGFQKANSTVCRSRVKCVCSVREVCGFRKVVSVHDGGIYWMPL